MTDEMGRREFLKRGTVAGVLATTGLPLAHPRDGIAWTSETPHMAPELAARHFDSKEFCLSEYDAITPALSFSATDEASARRWQVQARRKLIERLGGFPAMRSPLNAEVVERRDFGTHLRVPSQPDQSGEHLQHRSQARLRQQRERVAAADDKVPVPGRHQSAATIVFAF